MSSTDATPDFQTVYPWITNAFFERILRADQQDDSITVTGYTLKAALGKGENYASQMLRSRIDYTKSASNTEVHSISFIIKAVLANAEMAALTTELGVFRKEIIAFQQVIPAVEKLLRSIGDYSKLSAKCYDSSLEHSYLVFEDLAVSGYSNVNRRTGLDMEHFKHVLTKAAKWHAATAVLVHEKDVADKLAATYHESVSDSDLMQAIYKNTVRALVDVTVEIAGLEYLSAKFQRLIDVINERVSAASATDMAQFNVLNHGDMWSNNVMFQHDGAGGGDKVLDVKFVDFQCCYVGSPVLDLVYAFYTSSAGSIRSVDWDELMSLYWQTLCDALRKLNYSARPIPTLDELQADRRSRTNYSLYNGLFGLAVRNMEVVADDALGKMMDDSSENHLARVEMILNPKIRNELKFLLEFFDANGLFD